MGLRILPVNHFDAATIAVTPPAVSTMPLSNLQSNVRDRAWRSPNLDQQVIEGNWGGNARQVSAWGAWPGVGTACLIGSKWRVQLFADLAMTSSVYDSGTLDFFTFSGIGWGLFKWGALPWGTDINDKTARLAPKLIYLTSAVAAASFRVTITNGGAVDTPYFEARRIWIGDYVEAPNTAEYGLAPAWRTASKHQRTPGGTLRRNAKGKWRELRFETIIYSEADRATWADLMAYCDPAREIVIDLFPGDASRRQRDFIGMGSLEVLNPLVFENPDFHRLQLALVES